MSHSMSPAVRRILAIATLGLSLGVMNTQAQQMGDATAGSTKSATCTACHGLNGNSVNPEWPVLAGLTLYVVSVGVWIVGLSRVDVSIAYPMLSLGYVVNALAAWWLFGEMIGPLRVAGILLILAGVFLIARS